MDSSPADMHQTCKRQSIREFTLEDVIADPGIGKGIFAGLQSEGCVIVTHAIEAITYYEALSSSSAAPPLTPAVGGNRAHKEVKVGAPVVQHDSEIKVSLVP